MNSENLMAKAEINIYAPVYKVWETLIDSESNGKFMFDTKVETDWKVGSEISWKGEWKGQQFEDTGKILKMEPGKILQYTHHSQMMERAEDPDNYHTITISLSDSNDSTLVTLTQDKNKTENDRNDAQNNWNKMLSSLKELIEGEEH